MAMTRQSSGKGHMPLRVEVSRKPEKKSRLRKLAPRLILSKGGYGLRESLIHENAVCALTVNCVSPPLVSVEAPLTIFKMEG